MPTCPVVKVLRLLLKNHNCRRDNKNITYHSIVLFLILADVFTVTTTLDYLMLLIVGHHFF